MKKPVVAAAAVLSLVTLVACNQPVAEEDGGTGGGTTGGGTTGGGTTGGGTTGGGTTGGGTGGASGGGTGGASGGGTGGGTTGGGSGTDGGTLARFSFFVTSYAAIQRVSGSANGFGGDLRHGETGLGAGLRGADKICTEIAEYSMPGAGAKVWRAFLSADQGDDGGVVNARDRIGNGPWYDRQGRVFAMTLADAIGANRPIGCDQAICNDLPNEDGVPNHAPNGTLVDNHDMLTGSTSMGLRYTSTMTAPSANCLSWTTSSTTTSMTGRPRVGHSWPAMSGQNWMNALTEGGCGAGVNLVEMGGPNGPTVGSGGGYGGFYCFALSP